MQKPIWLIAAALVLAPCALRAQTAGAAYYVSAAGNDSNDGLTEATAFKTLGYALMKAVDDRIKTITVIGTLNQASEGGDSQRVFSLVSFTDTEILITGVPNVTGARRAVLSAAGTKKIGMRITMSKIRFEHIEISGSPKRGLEVSVDAEVTLGEGAAVRNNSGGGVIIYTVKEEMRDRAKPGSLILDGGIVEGNRCTDEAGAGIVVNGAFTMKRGTVRNNTILGRNYGGGGIFIDSSEPVTITGGEISGNKAPGAGGVYIVDGRVTMTGGSITGNTATDVVGGVYVIGGAVFTQQGGTISGNKAAKDTRTDTWDIMRVD